MAKREPPVELFYRPEDLDPRAPRLRIGKHKGRWEVREGEDVLLSSHAILPDAIDAALERSEASFREILVRGADGRQEWSVHHNPEWMELIRLLVHTAPVRSEAAA